MNDFENWVNNHIDLKLLKLYGFTDVLNELVLLLLDTLNLTSDNLHDKAKKAIPSKGVQDLRGAKEEAEKAALPEVNSNLRKARDTLESIGRGSAG